jgi:hypothetical protein
MNYYLKSSLVLGVLGTLVYGEVQGESQQHTQYVAVSPANNFVASGGYVSNVSASTVTYTYQPSPVALEYLLPHDRLAIHAAALAPPTVKLARSISATGANPFFRRRQRAPRLEVQSPEVPPFWCSSFQKFRGRMVT